MFIPQTGEYSFTCSYADDILVAWIDNDYGAKDLARPNADIIMILATPNPGRQLTYKKNFQQGNYISLWLAYANAGGPGSFQFQVTGPDGKDIVSKDNTMESPFLVQRSCDGSTAPKFGPWAPKIPKAWLKK